MVAKDGGSCTGTPMGLAWRASTGDTVWGFWCVSSNEAGICREACKVKVNIMLIYKLNICGLLTIRRILL